jgi:GrpB-like predicted nucleotidyltransferase (UPF0157 family)
VDGDERNVHLDRVLVGGRERPSITLEAHRPEWAERFAAERARIRAALGDRAHAVEHIGSTAVPDLMAKPIVDMLVTVSDPQAREVRSALERAGYVLRVDEPGHRMFRTPARDVHVHVWPDESPEVARHLAFRDRLRASPADRRLYEERKRELAGRDWEDMNHYADAKGPVIEAILERALGGHGR